MKHETLSVLEKLRVDARGSAGHFPSVTSFCVSTVFRFSSSFISSHLSGALPASHFWFLRYSHSCTGRASAIFLLIDSCSEDVMRDPVAICLLGFLFVR